jgi:hypothetical protein
LLNNPDGVESDDHIDESKHDNQHVKEIEGTDIDITNSKLSDEPPRESAQLPESTQEADAAQLPESTQEAAQLPELTQPTAAQLPELTKPDITSNQVFIEFNDEKQVTDSPKTNVHSVSVLSPISSAKGLIAKELHLDDRPGPSLDKPDIEKSLDESEMDYAKTNDQDSQTALVEKHDAVVEKTDVAVAQHSEKDLDTRQAQEQKVVEARPVVSVVQESLLTQEHQTGPEIPVLSSQPEPVPVLLSQTDHSPVLSSQTEPVPVLSSQTEPVPVSGPSSS